MVTFLGFTTGLFLGALLGVTFGAWIYISECKETINRATEQLRINEELLEDAIAKEIIATDEQK